MAAAARPGHSLRGGLLVWPDGQAGGPARGQSGSCAGMRRAGRQRVEEPSRLERQGTGWRPSRRPTLQQATKTAPRSVSWARGGAPRRVSDPVRLDSRRCTRPHDGGLSEAGRGHSGRPHGRSRACVVRRARPVAATWRRRRPPGGRPWRVPWRRKCALWVCVGRSVDRGSQ